MDNLLCALGFNLNVSPSIESKYWRGSVKGPLAGRRIIFDLMQALQFIFTFFNPYKFGILFVIWEVFINIFRPGWPNR